MLKEEIKRIFISQRDFLLKQKAEIKRELLDKIDIESKLISIITGIRRSGKSTLLRQVLQKHENPVFVNFEDPRLISFEISDFEKLEQVFEEEAGQFDAAFFDEIQIIKGWELYIRNAYDRGLKIYLTGSNAHLLSRELGSKLTGRYVSFELFPFSFTEFCEIKKLSPGFESFEKYFREGGFPEFIQNGQVQYLQNIFSDILNRDILIRYGLKNQRVLFELATFIISNTGKEYSLRNLSEILQIKSVNTVKDYIKYLEDSYLIQSISLFTSSLKRQIKNNKKVYCIDNRLIEENSISFSDDYGRKLENLVFYELRRENKEIFYFKEKDECDFVVKSRTENPSFYQVSFELNNSNLKREINGLKKGLQNYPESPGIILTYNQKDKIDGFDVVPVYEWMQTIR